MGEVNSLYLLKVLPIGRENGIGSSDRLAYTSNFVA